MIDQLMILAESGDHATGGVPAPAVGIGVFIIMMLLLAVTYLTGGANQRKRRTSDDRDDDH